MKSLLPLLFSVLNLVVLNAQTWIRQNPFPKLSVIQDLHFDGGYGLAVGTESTLFTTTNGGVTWIPRKAPQEGGFFQAALVVPGTNGQLMFAGGYQLIVSHNGGETWNPTNAATQQVYKIQYLGSETILVFDTDYGLLSSDNGETWDLVSFPGTNTSAGHFTNELNGWVVYGGFNNNQVWVTTDGGDSWSLRDTLKHPVVAEVTMINPLTGFLGSRDFVYKTTDGGNTWNKMHQNPVNSIRDMHVVNENEIWTCQNNGFIFYTTNGGGQWTDLNPNIISSNQTPGIYANEEGKVWVGGKFVSIMYSSNYAADWTDQIPNAKGIMYQPHFINETTGLIGSSEGIILKTVNGGASYDKIQLNPDDYFRAVQMITPQAMVIGSTSGKVFGSMDQGETWSLIGDQFGNITDIHAFDLQTAVVLSESGRIYRTENTGMQWDEVYTMGQAGNLYGLHFINHQLGWACGWNGQILHTSDGGVTWESTYSNGYSQFTDIHFTSAAEGWAVTSNASDSIWHTTNGGLNWQSSKLPAGTFWHKVSFTNPDTGWVTGGSAGYGLILRTNNGGQDWTIDHQAPEAFFGLYALPGKETVWATGIGGNIEKYSPCTFNPTINNLSGEEMPCQRDTIMYSVASAGVDIFHWTFPPDWLIYGNPNTSNIQVIAGIQPGMIHVNGSDGCNNTTSELTLSVNPVAVPQALISESDGVLSCNLAGGFIQWLLDGAPISGANEASYSPPVSGQYEAVVTMFGTGCQSRSNALTIFINAAADPDKNQLVISPNPSHGNLSVSYNSSLNNPTEGYISVFDLEGRTKVERQKFTGKIEIDGLPAGIYIIVIQLDAKIFAQKIMVE